MAHTIMKEIYDDEKKKYIQCEVLVLDEEEELPETDRREILLYCTEEYMNDLYPETDLIEQYEDFENRQ